MKKIILPLIGLCLVAVGLLAWRPSTYSVDGLYPNPDKDEPNLSACTKTTFNQIATMRDAWQKSLTAMMAQEKPASEMVDEGFESIRTYRCWLDYLCGAVLYSANADPKSTLNNPEDLGNGYRPLTVAEIEQVPGCASPNGLQIPDTQIQYISACRVGDGNKTIEGAHGNYAKCRNMVDQENSVAAIELTKTLKDNSAQQLARPLREKFSSILLKLHAMEAHMSILSQQVQSLDVRLPCYAAKCD